MKTRELDTYLLTSSKGSALPLRAKRKGQSHRIVKSAVCAIMSEVTDELFADDDLMVKVPGNVQLVACGCRIYLCS